ncbi:MAG TPA: PKD domain-containing protein [Chitinophagaceae bacterium]|jgi:PKD repeat protein|nr:PKD domain-containing protein [Chitinophagaceae bacterium]
MKKFSLFTLAAGLLLFTGCNQKDPVPPATDANFSISGFQNPLPTSLNFLNTSTNATSYLWDFGDGSTSTQSNPTHAYTLAGTYLLQLTATGPTGSETACKLVTLETVTPGASAYSYFFDRCDGSPVGASFKTVNPASSGIYWNFNGTVNTTRDPIVQFPLPGDYTIKYSTVVSGVRDTITRIIQIH